MWFLFILIPAASAISSSMFSLTKGTRLVTAGLAANEWQRRRGFKPGEGQISERANDTYFGVFFDRDDEYDLNRKLGLLQEQSPKAMKHVAGLKYDLTKTEAEFLRTLLEPAMVALEELEQVKQAILESGPLEVDQVMEILDISLEKFSITLSPVLRWLEQFPDTRTKAA